MPGIDFHINKQLILLNKLNYSQEFKDLYDSNHGLNGFRFGNGSFEAGDAESLYQICRHFQPKVVIEIGSGQSTKVLSAALRVNNQNNCVETTHYCIEPYATKEIKKLKVEIIKRKVEDIDLSFFQKLNSGDLLFIDSSHMIRPQGDVLYEYLQILPLLKPGVIVHVHDIFTPRDYPEEFLFGKSLFWNEQYLLEAIISNTSRYEVILAANLIKNRCFSDMSQVAPFLTPLDEPGSFYFRIKNQGH